MRRTLLGKTAVVYLCVFATGKHGKSKVVAEISGLKGADGVLVLYRGREAVRKQAM
jgi:hypothetical protein